MNRVVRWSRLLVCALIALGPATVTVAADARPANGVHAPSPAPSLRTHLRAVNAGTTMHGDFDGDGYADAAVGVDLKDVNGQVDAGAISIIYGSPTGLASARNRMISQDSAGALDQAEAGDSFGRYMGGGDFNADGYFDLAVGVPLEDVDGPSGLIVDAGAVQIFYGSARGITAASNQFFTQLDLSTNDTAEANDWFGSRLQGGDFNGDGFDDLAASAMFEDVPPPSGGDEVVNGGAVDILYGSALGLTAVGSQFWNQNSDNILNQANYGDLFGRALGSGDFNGDGYADLGVGIAHEDVDGIIDAGALAVLYGSATGLTADGNQFWSQNSPDILDDAEKSDWMGRTGVTGGDFNGDGFDDVAVGALQDSVDGFGKAGVVNVIYGSVDGLTAVGNQLFSENTPGSVSDGAETGDRFGRTVESADFNGDGYLDLAIGISNENVGPALSAGAMVTLYGSAAGLTMDGNQYWTQDSPGILDQAENGDGFDGRVPDFGDMNGDGYADIAVGVFKESIEGQTTLRAAGAMNVIYGSAAGLTDVGNQFWNLDSPGIKGIAEAMDAFGQSNVG